MTGFTQFLKEVDSASNQLPINSFPILADRIFTPTLFSGTNKREKRFWEFFTANIRNKNTRAAYLTACYKFSYWCEARSIQLEQVEPMIVAAYIEEITKTYAPSSVKQHLAAIRVLFDWLVIGQVTPFNPASSVRGPKNIVKVGKTPVLDAQEVNQLLRAIDLNSIIGLRDRALIGLMIYSFARVSAAVNMNVADYYTQGKRSFFKLHEKGGKYHVVPAHHQAQNYLDEYIQAADIGKNRNLPLFRSAPSGRNPKQLTPNAMSRFTALNMIKRRALKAGLPEEICNHSFRGTGITEYLRNGGTLEKGAEIANHESTKTTQLYNRVLEEISLSEIERIHL